MDALRISVLYFRQFCFYLAEQINALFVQAGIDAELFSIDIALIIGVITGFILHTFFAQSKTTSHHTPPYPTGEQPVTVDGKTKDEVRKKS